MKTRTKKSSKTASASTQDNAAVPVQRLPQRDQEPSRLVVLPNGITDDARMLTLPRPSTQRQLSRYLLDPTRGCFEFTIVGDDKSLQSWLLTPPQHDATQSADDGEAYILQKPQMQIATPIDPLFLVLPMMHAADASCPGMYRTWIDVLYDDATDQWQALRQLLRGDRWSAMQRRLESGMARISDSLQLGEDDDPTYRLSPSKLAAILLHKAIATVASGFPASLEERFIRQALEVPTHDVIDSEELADTTQSAITSSVSDGSQANNTSQSTSASQLTATTSQSSSASQSTAATSMADTAPQSVATQDVKRLLRIRTTYEFMLRSYVPSTLQHQVQHCLPNLHGIVDLSPLIEYEKLVASKRTELQALRTLSDNISRKRKLDDDEAADKAEEKRKKKEEEEAKKKAVSQGVKKLMKADTSGMKKLSSFFTKKVAT